MAQVIGDRTTNQAITETRLIRQVGAEISLLEPNEAPLITFLNRLKKRRAVKSPRWEWFEDDYVARWTQNGTSTVANSTSSTTITVVDGTLFVPGDTFVVPKATSSSSAPEVCRVTVVSTNTLTVVRDIGGVGADTILPSAALRLMGTSYEEGGTIPSAKTTAPVGKITYTQIFRDVIDMANTNIASAQYGTSNERQRLHQKALKSHKIKMNMAFLFGQPSESLAGGPTGKPIRTTMGLNNTISTNVVDAAGTLTMKTFETFSRAAFRYGKNEKLLLCSPIVKSAINSWGNNYLMVKPGEKKWGVNVQEVQTAHGTWLVTNDWMLETAISGQNGFGNMAFSIDVDMLDMIYLSGNGENRDTHIRENVILDGRDAKVDEILSEIGLVVMQEKWHAKLFDVTDYSQ
ncbi:MAG TPA: DUF5309 family protein [Verrucomicrobiae bacterium]|nr:DUF5309 family protein [Verrucomicrobiae bacterium]